MVDECGADEPRTRQEVVAHHHASVLVPTAELLVKPCLFSKFLSIGISGIHSHMIFLQRVPSSNSFLLLGSSHEGVCALAQTYHYGLDTVMARATMPHMVGWSNGSVRQGRVPQTTTLEKAFVVPFWYARPKSVVNRNPSYRNRLNQKVESTSVLFSTWFQYCGEKQTRHPVSICWVSLRSPIDQTKYKEGNLIDSSVYIKQRWSISALWCHHNSL